MKPTRRQFIRAAAAALGYCSIDGSFAWSQPAALPKARQIGRKSVVVRKKSEFIHVDNAVRVGYLQEIVEQCLQMFTRQPTPQQAWAALFSTNDVIGLKFDGLSGGILTSEKPMAAALVQSLLSSGWTSEQIIIASEQAGLAEQVGATAVQRGWSDKSVDYVSGSDQLSSFVEQVDAFVNVPILRDDNIMGISGCLKNITYHLVKHPARLHDSRGVPYFVDIAALPQIHDKLKLNILNAVQVVFDDGPLVTNPDNVDLTGLVLLGSDPVAVDAVGLESINAVRRDHGLEVIPLDKAHVPALLDADARAYGNANFRRIERLTPIDH